MNRESRRLHPIAIITDFGVEDFYASVMKAVILRHSPDQKFIDVTHAIPPHDLLQGSFVLARVFPYFPPGTVFLVVVDPGVGGARRNLIFEAENKYVIVPDNGVITDLGEEGNIAGCYEIKGNALNGYRLHQALGKTFWGRDILAPAALALASGAPCGDLGERVGDFVTLQLPELILRDGYIRGCGRYMDHFGNIITNIPGESIYSAFGKLPASKINVYIKDRLIKGIREYYSEVREGDLLAVRGSWSRLEIAVNGGKAAEVLACKKPSDMLIELRVD